jgi:hypothetical protein
MITARNRTAPWGSPLGRRRWGFSFNPLYPLELQTYRTAPLGDSRPIASAEEISTLRRRKREMRGWETMGTVITVPRGGVLRSPVSVRPAPGMEPHRRSELTREGAK